MSAAELREKLAAIEHERWADWQKWCHQVLRENLNKDGLNLDLEEVLLRWDKQIATKYPQLTELEKESDMEQVNRYWYLIEEHINQEVLKALDSITEEMFTAERMAWRDEEGTTLETNVFRVNMKASITKVRATYTQDTTK